ncbi:MAG: 3-dehydroquinate synthase [Gammaproteobacteria bacterium]|nr:3-dehydroquinate synthase [Gammaproteobacteria bacterium]
MITVTVDLKQRSYPIFIGSGLLNQPGLLDPYIEGRDVLVVTSESIAPLYLEPLQQMLGQSRHSVVVLPDGEHHKNLTTLNLIFDELVAQRFGRDCVLVALGGGVVGDMCGFAAASWQRGVDFIQVPTTLLAQVDSAVGGKTAVNHAGGKNLIGAFHQPLCVLADTDTLRTLPERELSAGLAEVVKYGLIKDAALFEWLESVAGKLINRDSPSLGHAIKRSCEIKAAVVAADEHERGQRTLLNMGHTFGHAIERCAGYGTVLHGEAVAAGSVMAATFSMRLGWISEADVERIKDLLVRLALPTQPPGMDAEEFYSAMSLDKKVAAGQIRLVLLRAIGDAELVTNYPGDQLLQLLREQLN